MTDITPNQNGGVLKHILNEGVGDKFPLPGSKVKIHYLVYVNDEILNLFHNHEVELGRDNLIKGMEIGIPTMKKNEVADFVCVPEYAVRQKQSLFPPNQDHIYRIKLVSFRAKDLSPFHDGGIKRYHTLVVGKRYRSPIKNDVVHVHLVGQYEEKIFDKRDVIFVINAYSDSNVISGIKIALLKFNEGETSRLKIKPKYAFDVLGCEEWGIPPNATVDYTVTLKSIKNYWSLSPEQRIQQAEFFQDTADQFYEMSKFHLAYINYVKIQTYLEVDKDVRDDLSEKRYNLLLISYLKSSEVSLLMLKYTYAYDNANKALKIDPGNLKGLLYRSKAHLGLLEYDLATDDLERCLELDPTNQQAQMLYALYCMNN